ncbi:hypothetical protein V6N13_007612 [Hibiscus sabdariffa]|uniref:RRM domain-containing protein n=1 Tax=Hibiscus sabdariffa TaxID=183260 RepID=A0ABR2EN53_9ROSI
MAPVKRHQCQHRCHRDGSKPGKEYARLGVSFFVNFVYKMIHLTTLKEAFSMYGIITDICIVYKNPNRFNRRHTFTFVRFKTQEGACVAVARGNNRRMNEYTIKIFLARSQETKIGASSAVTKPKRHTNTRSNSYKLTNGRS